MRNQGAARSSHAPCFPAATGIAQVFALAEAISQTRIMLDYVKELLEIRISIPQHNKSLCELARKGGRLLPHLQAGGAAVVAVASGYRLRPPHPPPTRPMARPSRKLAGRAPAPAQENLRFQSLGFSSVAPRNGRRAATLRGKRSLAFLSFDIWSNHLSNLFECFRCSIPFQRRTK